MKKTKLWKRIAGWLLVFLLVLQLPVNAFAGEWADNTSYSSEELLCSVMEQTSLKIKQTKKKKYR